jgi:hypothetical protein
MNVQHLKEPELEFGVGHHIDIRFGLMNHGPLDYDDPLGPRQIKVGIVGITQGVERLAEWFALCRNEIEAKTSNKSNLFPHFPGLDATFHSTLLLDSPLIRTIHPNIFDQLATKTRGSALVDKDVDIII